METEPTVSVILPVYNVGAYLDVCMESLLRQTFGDMEITFVDSGKPYDPLAKADPDTTQSIEERPIGGMGILIVKKSMDAVDYEYKDGKNILTIKKNFTSETEE